MGCIYSVDHVEALRRQALDAGLSAPGAFWAASPKVLAECYNGIGPDRWSSLMRGFVTRVLEFYEADALIHDWEYTYQPKTRRAFLTANIRFGYNTVRNAIYRYGFCKLALRIAGIGVVLACLCQLGGWQGYQPAQRDSKNEKNV